MFEGTDHIAIKAVFFRKVEPEHLGAPKRQILRLGIESMEARCKECGEEWTARPGHHGGPPGTFATGEWHHYLSCPKCGVEEALERE